MGVVGGIALIIGSVTLASRIGGPFQTQKQREAQSQRASLQRITALRTVDTDRDGLSDFDELYVRHTSPYLADTDSDKTPDGAEVQAGTDPNCPAGSTCGPLAAGNAKDGNTNAGPISAALAGTLTPAELRKVLAGAGAPQYLLDATPDADLLRLYQETIGSSANTNAAASTASTNGTVNASALQNLTAADIRKLLIQNGIAADTLDGVDDATLRSIFLQSLNDVQSNTNATP